MNRDRILEYLYDEMNPSSKREFETELLNNPKLKKELEELTQVRTFLAQSQDQRPQPLELVVNPVRTTRRISRWWAIAASLLMLIVAGKTFDFRVQTQGSNLVVGFGPYTASEELKSNEQQEQYAKLRSAINDLQKQVSAYAIPSDDATVAPVSLSENQKLAGWIVSAMKQEQSNLESRLANKILEDQQIYMQGVAQNLMNYWNEQRKNDLQMINSGMQQLVQALQLPPQDLAQFVNNTQQNY